MPPCRLIVFHGIKLGNPDRPAVRPVEPCDEVKKRGFASAVWPEQAIDFPRFGLQVDVVDSLYLPQRFVDVLKQHGILALIACHGGTTPFAPERVIRLLGFHA